MKTILLNGKWNGRCIFGTPDKDFDFEGSVPGSTVNDLIRNGRLPEDIFYRDNARRVCEYELCSYIYSREFEYEGECGRAELRFERLDTYSDIYLNGVLLGHRENGNISHIFSADGLIKEGINKIEIRFASPVVSTEGLESRPGAFTTERLYTRRMQCTYGWDWVARFISCGIGSASLVIKDECEISPEIYLYTKSVDDESASLGADISFGAPYKGRILKFVLTDPEGRAVYEKERFCDEPFVRLSFDVPGARLWYPIGYGEQPLYDFTVLEGDNFENEIFSEKIGIRTVKIQQIKDVPGSAEALKCDMIRNPDYDFNTVSSGFILKVNGIKIMCKGANWVPCEPFETGTGKSRITEILELAAEMGLNILRIWGGGAFEKEHFYNECSRLGIMVTQDFLMACGHYPEEKEEFISALQEEAAYAARLIRNKPCLMWWSGDNENAVNGCDTDTDYWGRRSAYYGIAPVLYRMDPYREFLPSSPYGGRKYASNTIGTTHNTQFLDRTFEYFERPGPLSDYKEVLKRYRARFIAEEPQLGAVSVPSLRRFMTEDDIFGNDSTMWRVHTKNNPALKKEVFDYMCEFAEKVLGHFTDGYDRAFKLRYIQYEWLRVVMEQARREKWFCSGIIFWMLNDCWPAASGWALIDYYNNPKDAFYSFKRAAKPVIGSFDCDCGGNCDAGNCDGDRGGDDCGDRDGDDCGCAGDGRCRLSAINDTNHTAHVRAEIYKLTPDLKGYDIIKTVEADIEKGASTVIYTCPEIQEGDILIADITSDISSDISSDITPDIISGESGGSTDRTFYRKGALPLRAVKAADEDALEYSVDEEAGTVTLSAKSYIHAAELEGRIVLSDNCFSLLPGRSRTVSFRRLDGYDGINVNAYTLASD